MKSYEYNMDPLFQNMDLTHNEEQQLQEEAKIIYDEIETDLIQSRKVHKWLSIASLIVIIFAFIYYIFRFTQGQESFALQLKNNYGVFIYLIIFASMGAYFFIKYKQLNQLITKNENNKSQYQQQLFEELKENELIERQNTLIKEIDHKFNYLNDLYINDNDEITRLYTLISIDDCTTTELKFNLQNYMTTDDYIKKNDLSELSTELIQQNCQYSPLNQEQIINYLDTIYALASLKATQSQITLQNRLKKANKKRKKVIELTNEFNVKNRELNQQINELKEQHAELLNENQQIIASI